MWLDTQHGYATHAFTSGQPDKQKGYGYIQDFPQYRGVLDRKNQRLQILEGLLSLQS